MLQRLSGAIRAAPLELIGDELARQLCRPPRILAHRAVGRVARGEHVPGARGLHVEHTPRRGNAIEVAVGVDVAALGAVRHHDLGHPEPRGRRGVERAVRHDDRLVFGQLEDVEMGQQVRREVAVLDERAQAVGPHQPLPVVDDAMAARRQQGQRFGREVRAQQRSEVHPGGLGVGGGDLCLPQTGPIASTDM